MSDDNDAAVLDFVTNHVEALPPPTPTTTTIAPLPENESNRSTHDSRTAGNGDRDGDDGDDATPPTSPSGGGNDPRRRNMIGNSIYKSTDRGIIVPVLDGNGERGLVDDNNGADTDTASWNEVLAACCCHSLWEWFRIGVVLCILLFFLYFFLVGLDLLGTAFQVVGGCTAGSLLGADTNPLASVLIGIVATALLQSSSTSTSIVVALCGSGLDVQQGIYIVMGANVGSAITSMLVSMAHMGSGPELERAFAGSALYYLFNILTCIILLPVEVGTNYLYVLTEAMLPSSMGDAGSSWNSPIKAIVTPLTKKVIVANKQLIQEVSTGELESCDAAYPVTCENNVVSYQTCRAGLIGCDPSTGRCPAFFMDGATEKDDAVAGWVCLIFAILILCVCLVGLVAVLRKLLLGASQRIIYKATNINGVLAILVGTGVTVLVQSSAVTTSTLIPLCGVGVLKLEQMYPLVLGADIGTTFTALMAALVSTKLQSLQIALAHLMFNVTGIVIFYPVPFMRRVVIRLAEHLGKIVRHWRGFPIVFIIVVFFVIPIVLLGISTCFEKKSTGFTALGVFVVLLVVGGIGYFYYWWRWNGGKASCNKCIRKRQRKHAAIDSLADDMDYVKADIEYCKKEILHIKDYSNIPFKHSVRMDEHGRPVITFFPPSAEEDAEEAAAAAAAAEDLANQVSLLEECHVQNWRDILLAAADTIQDEIGSAVGSAQDRLGGSVRSVTRMALSASNRSSRRGAAAAAAGLTRSGRGSRRAAVAAAAKARAAAAAAAQKEEEEPKQESAP